MEENLQTIQVNKTSVFVHNIITALKAYSQKLKALLIPLLLSTLLKINNSLSVFKNKLLSLRPSSPNLGYTPRPNFRGGREKKILIASGIVLGVLLAVGLFIGVTGKSSTSYTYSDTRPDAATAKARQELNKEFLFPITDEDGKEAGEINYIILNAELQDSIIVKGQRAQAVKGRTFLILNLKIVNDNSQGVEINTKDYVRLSVNNKDEWIASDIHNDPVEVQAISTKYTRIGFPINDTDKDLTLKIGEINGNKETLGLNLKPL